MRRSNLFLSLALLSVIGGGSYLTACGSDSSEFNGGGDQNGDGGDTSEDGGGGGFGDGGIDHSKDAGGGAECNHVIKATIRDFKPCNMKHSDDHQYDLDHCDTKVGHPDFQHYFGSEQTPGIVQATLGSDHKPVYAGTGRHTYPGTTDQYETTGPSQFRQWYNDVAGTGPDSNKNIPIMITLKETSAGSGHYRYENHAFFPIDGKGWGNTPTGDGTDGHNFAFTTEVHLSFTYKGGEVFTFVGDDDLWLFINNKLAIDLGGLHPSVTGSVNLDKFAAANGMKKGQTYPLDLFHAERHATASNFTIDTTIDCIENPPIH